ncbi:MAG TPA: hypothetical protein VK862_05735 [Afifellaceae bacterium]|nr:hypothetical protein [Afifellaceae bacterium]
MAIAAIRLFLLLYRVAGSPRPDFEVTYAKFCGNRFSADPAGRRLQSAGAGSTGGAAESPELFETQGF